MFSQLNLFYIFDRIKRKVSEPFVPPDKRSKSIPSRRLARLKEQKRKMLAVQEDDAVEIKKIWTRLRQSYFPSRIDLDDYTVRWSGRRQRRTLASCNVARRTVIVAKEMRSPHAHAYLEPLIYHEMCHAVLGHNVAKAGDRRLWHGPEFKELERKHPLVPSLDLWIKDGGWSTVVRSERTKAYHRSRKR